jgi:predicted permease
MLHALRSLWKSPAFTLTAILTIALGIGVNTAAFSLIHTVLLDPLPFRDPMRLVHVAETHPEFPSFQVAAPDFADWQSRNTSFDELAAHTFSAMNRWVIVGDGEPEPVHVVQASARLFPMLGIQPLQGLPYTIEEENKKTPVVVISESLWRRKYHADPRIIGRNITLVGWPVTVVGVISTQQAQPQWADLWMPLTFLDPALTESRRFHTLEVIGRLKPGVTIERAQAEMRVIATQLGREHPDTNATIGATVLPLDHWIAGESRPVLFIAWTAVGLVLLLACANVAHLVLVRAVQRQKEMAIREAIGAGAGRLARYLLVENLILAALGGALGFILARGLLPLLLHRTGLPRLYSAALSNEALVFGLAATLICGLLFAAPALLHLPRKRLHQLIGQSGGLSLSHRRSLLGPFVIATEIALAFAVIAGAGLLYRSYRALSNENPGFDARNVIAAEVPLGFQSWEESAQVFETKLRPRLRDIPGVTHVSLVNAGPLLLSGTELSRFTTRFAVPGRPVTGGSYPVAQIRWITPQYFDTLRIPLKAGRFFTRPGDPGYVINETLARLYFPNQNPIGKQILKNVITDTPQAVTIIGVVADVRDLGLDVAPRPTLYELGISNTMTVLVRTARDTASAIPAVREAIRSLAPNEPIRILAPLDSIVEASLEKRRFALDLLGVFAALAALLTVIGIYGVIAYSLSHRSGEFAVRLALGAAPGHVLLLILKAFATPALAGLIAGTILALALAQALRTQLYKLSPTDPIALAATALTIATLILLAALRPATKATKISPATLLRQ